MPDKEAARLLELYPAFTGKIRAALKKPRLPFLVVVTKTDKIDANKVEGARAQVELRISTALAGDVLDVHFVHNFTRTATRVSRHQEPRVNSWDVDRRSSRGEEITRDY
jgi:GTP-binding protein EngB required for normal cell division